MKNNNKQKAYTSDLLVLLITIEYIFLPRFHVIGPFKICHIVMAVWTLCYLLRIRGFRVNEEADHNIRLILILLLIGVIGEITLVVSTTIYGESKLVEGILLFVNMICAIGIGYNYYSYNKNILLFLLYSNIFCNILVTVMGSDVPSFFSYFWASFRETGVRNHGIVGNANSSMAIMNICLLAVVVMVNKKKLRLSNINFVLVLTLPLFCVLLINSRGEFVSTILLEIPLCIGQYKARKENGGVGSLFFQIVFSVIALLGFYFLFFNVLVNLIPRLSNSLQRLDTLYDVLGYESEATSESILRPLYNWNQFFVRFIKSPIWGSGFSRGTDPAYYHVVGYHNDIFTSLVSCGAFGFFIWIILLKRAIKACGWYMLIPLLVTGLTNTFLYSNGCITIYMLVFGTMIHYNEIEGTVVLSPTGE